MGINFKQFIKEIAIIQSRIIGCMLVWEIFSTPDFGIQSDSITGLLEYVIFSLATEFFYLRIASKLIRKRKCPDK